MPRDTGSNTYFYDGAEVDAVMNASTDTGQNSFWFNGTEVHVILSPGLAGSFFLMFY